MSSIFNKLRKPIKAFKSFIGKGSNAKEYTTIAEVFHGLRTSINDSLNGKNGKDVSFDTVDGTENKSTLHYETDPEVVRDLLKKGIDPNTENKNGETALEVTGNFEIAKMLLEHGATVYSKQQMDKILYHCGHNPAKKIILSLLMHNNTDYTKDNLIKQCKDGQKLKQLIKQAREVKELMYQTEEVEMLRKHCTKLQKLIKQAREVKELIYQTEEVKDGNQIVSKIILDYIKNQEDSNLKAQLIHTCQNLGLIDDSLKVAPENKVDEALELAGEITVINYYVD